MQTFNYHKVSEDRKEWFLFEVFLVLCQTVRWWKPAMKSNMITGHNYAQGM